MRIKILTLIFSSTLIWGCSKNSSTNSPKGTTVKYEVVTSLPATPDLNGPNILTYTDSTGKLVNDSSFNSGTTWSKTITITNPARPFQLNFNAYFLTNPASSSSVATGNIYVNGQLKATVSSFTSFQVQDVNMTYTIH